MKDGRFETSIFLIIVQQRDFFPNMNFKIKGSFTDHVALALVLRPVVVPGLVPVRRPLPGVLEDGVDHGFADQDAQIHNEEGVHGPAGEAAR